MQSLTIGDKNITQTLRERKQNYLFAGLDEGAKRSAMFYSFFGTCKMNDVNPQDWLTYVLSKIADHKVNKLYELFPQNFKK